MGQVYVIYTISFALWTMEAIWKKRKLFLTEKDYRRKKKFTWKTGKKNHWLCICAMISLKAVWSSRSRITLFRCQRFNNWVFCYGLWFEIIHLWTLGATRHNRLHRRQHRECTSSCGGRHQSVGKGRWTSRAWHRKLQGSFDPLFESIEITRRLNV